MWLNSDVSDESIKATGLSVLIELATLRAEVQSMRTEKEKLLSEKKNIVMEKEELSHELAEIKGKLACQTTLVDQLRTELNASREKCVLASSEEMILRNHKAILESYVRLVACPNRLRHEMETFALRYLPSVEFANNRQQVIHQLVDSNMMLKLRTELVIKCARRLLSLSLLNPLTIRSKFTKVWHRLKNISPKLYPPGHGLCHSNLLSQSLIQIYNAPDVNQAIIIFNQDAAEVWKIRDKELLPHDAAALGQISLLPGNILLNLIQANERSTLNMKEQLYIEDVVQIGKIFTDEIIPKYYKSTIWVLYNSHHSDIIDILHQLEEKWPQLSPAHRADLYATSFAKLYDEVSTTGLHESGITLLFDNLFPTTTEFTKYLKHLSSKSNSMSFVAKTLFQPDPDPEAR